MLTIGIDLASQPKNTALCAIEWTGTDVIVQDCRLNVSNADIDAIAGGADKVGVDVPFGWPEAFVSALTAHRQRLAWPDATSLALRYRRTDLYIQAATSKWPLSVSSDRIACTAFRAALLMSRLAQRYGPIDRTCSGKFVEVYPRAARDRWDFTSFDALLAVTGDWLRLSDVVAANCRQSADCFDALVAALVTRAASIALCDPVPELDLEPAAVEEWIALPQQGSLGQLVSGNRVSANP